jgi:hypothetical protein
MGVAKVYGEASISYGRRELLTRSRRLPCPRFESIGRRMDSAFSLDVA